MIWVVSIKQAFTTLNRNRTLIAIALISVVFGKIIDLIEQFTDKTLYALVGESVNMNAFQQALESARTGHFEEFFRVLIGLRYLNLEQPQSLIIMGSLVIGSFLIAFYNDTGLASLIRDLLIQNSYRFSTGYYLWTDVFQTSLHLQRLVLLARRFCRYCDFSSAIFPVSHADFSYTRMDCNRDLRTTATYHLHRVPLARNEVYYHRRRKSYSHGISAYQSTHVGE